MFRIVTRLHERALVGNRVRYVLAQNSAEPIHPGDLFPLRVPEFFASNTKAQ